MYIKAFEESKSMVKKNEVNSDNISEEEKRLSELKSYKLLGVARDYLDRHGERLVSKVDYIL